MLQLALDRDSLFDEAGLRRLRESYMRDDEISPQERFAFVAKTFGTNQEHAQRIYEYSSKHWLSFSTPILSFGRTKKGLPISCFLPYLHDTSEGLIDTQAEVNWLSMLGGGIGIGVGIRSADEKSTGVMAHLKTYDASCLAYRQGTTRRGSYAAYLDISHPDIIPFLEMRKVTGDPRIRCPNLHHGINIPNAFMEIIEKCMKDSNTNDNWQLIDPHTKEIKQVVSAKHLWQKILELRMENGEPYLHFIDTSNEKLPKFLKDKGLTIKQSNLCVAPETVVLTKEFGQLPISELFIHGNVNVWNGSEWSKTKIIKTGTNQKLVSVELSNGIILNCTEYHKFYTTKNGKITEKRTHELLPGDKLIKFDLPIIDGYAKFPYAYTHGFFCGDGTYVNKLPKITLYGEKKNLVSRLDIKSGTHREDSNGRLNYMLQNDICDKFVVPSAYFSIESRLQWFAGLCDADGCMTDINGCFGIQIGNINKQFLTDILLMLQTLGIHSKINKMRDFGITQFRAQEKFYNTQPMYRLVIASSGVNSLLDLGLNCSRLNLRKCDPNRNSEHFIKVTSIEDNGRYDDTYCFTEEKKHMGMFNGVLTGQCTEIMLPTDKDRSAVCCLSSVNLEYWDEWKENSSFIRDVAEMLDNVLQYFIDNAPKTISRAIYSAQQERSVGIGALGFHAYLQKNHIPFESAIAKSVNKKMFDILNIDCKYANLTLGKLRGEAPDAKGTGYRFSHMQAIAPNASSSIIMGNTSPSIEPFKANVYSQDTLSGRTVNKNRYLDKLIKERCAIEGLEYTDVWSSILANKGSVQHLDFLDEHTKMVFKTALEIDQRWIIEHAADRQIFIDQGQSVNLFFPPTVDIKYLHLVHYLAWKKNLKSLYYCRSEKIGEADKVSQQIRREKIEEMDLTKEDTFEECLPCSG